MLSRIDWLTSELERAADRPIYIFMHHPPMRVHSRPLDMIGLMDEALFRGALEGHRDHIRHIFFGHCHLPLSYAPTRRSRKRPKRSRNLKPQ